MPEFLSEMWLRDLDRAVRAASPGAAPPPIVIEQVVNDVPGRGQVRYQFRIDGSGARVTEGAASDPPDVRLTTDYDTAVAIALGKENAQIALARGRLRLGGNIDTLVRSAGALGALDDATAVVRDNTTYPSP
ncbi:MAG TPA: SCP2 sterol-binding domain-containing protein [Acidimicrobiia bacterium]|nr:SCP2 sterol-binding domain-containing protein [Acidimicrobiia bacterium]